MIINNSVLNKNNKFIPKFSINIQLLVFLAVYFKEIKLRDEFI